MVSSIVYNDDGGHNYVYDANGNMTSGPDFSNLPTFASRTLAYNTDNMPVAVSAAGGALSITYDGDRASKQSTSGSTFYIGNHFEIIGGSATKYVFAGNLRVAKMAGTNVNYFHKDHLGSSTVMTDSTGTAAGIQASEYLPFGGSRGSDGVTVTNYKFTDQEHDPGSGLYNYDARLYDPVIGRFVSADSIVPDFYDPQSLNRYSYCLSNPLM